MAMFRKMTGSALIAAMLAASATPALARPGHGWGNPYGGGGYGRRWHRGHDDDFGNVLLGAVIAGGLFAIASAASKAKNERGDNGVVYGGDTRRGDRPRDSRDWSEAENEAASVCADSAEALASKRGIDAKVDDIDFVDRDSEGYRVEGRLEGGRSFNCGVRNGELTYIQFDNRVALR
jgi:opacity protein-like surface antigen